tara:strand:- start:5596 stop:6168 length:573 start_codon:yes stop_codon:yes gene_type:complete
MAMLTPQSESSNGFQIDELAPAGDYVATCIDVADEFGVTRKKYQSEETHDIDVTRFLFGFKGQDGSLYKIQTFEMTQSTSPRAKLMVFLTAWLSHSPKMNWDYCDMVGQGAVIKVEHVTSQMGKVYAKIAGISPAKTSLTDYSQQVVPVDHFAAPAAAAQAPVVAPAPTPASAPPSFSPNDSNPDANCPF